MASLDDLHARQSDIKARLQEIDAAADGEQFTDEQRVEWNALNEEFEAVSKHIAELSARMQRIEALNKADSVEDERTSYSRPAANKRVPDDPTALEEYRKFSSSVEELSRAYQEGALRITERLKPAWSGVDVEGSQERMERLLTVTDSAEDRAFAKRVIATSSPVYERAFNKYLIGQHLTPDEQRAMSLTTTAGGYAVPTTLDPTVILVSQGVVNPVRRLARVETITGNTWYGVSSTGISATYSAEAAEVADANPTFAQPSAVVEKAQAFIPFSIEIGQDFGNFSAEMSRLFADAKDTLESDKFLEGLGHDSNEPQGLIAVGGATAVVTSAATATIAAADLYSLESGLSPRWRPRATIVGNRAFFQKVRQLDTSGGANLWVQLSYDSPAILLGYPVAEWSDYSSAVTTSAATVATIGDFSQFLIVDRVGMDMELIPHLFATANNRPSGQRGLYCYWRNTSDVLTPGLQANSAFVSLKLL